MKKRTKKLLSRDAVPSAPLPQENGEKVFLLLFQTSKDVEKSQHDKFKEAARQLEAGESEAAFDEKLGKLVKHKPKDEKPQED